ncbi:MAG: 4-alpha-glucanotransferase [Erysipelotrichaceae bacterium]
MSKEHLITTHPNLGVMCPIFSLPSSYGIGDFGSAKVFLDYLSQSKFKTWQILPLNIIGYSNSPYQSLSSYGGDIVYIDLEELLSFYSLDFDLVEVAYQKYVDYQEVRARKKEFLALVYQQVKAELHNSKGYLNFLRTFPLIVQTCEFLVLKDYHDNVSWDKFNSKFDLNNSVMKDLFEFQLFTQYTFIRQWLQVKSMSKALNITIFGELPFYVGHDSADVYFNQTKFYLKDKELILKAGVPADSFSNKGQFWGNPIYRWDILAQDNYTFWLNRIKYQMQMYDVVRLDHFRAFDTYWAVPANSDTALAGKWLPGPSYNFFDIVFEEIPDVNIVVENLGLVNEGVERLRKHYKLRGMSVMQYLFNWDSEELFNLDNNNTILSSGTCNTQTLRGYYMSLSAAQKDQIYQYFVAENKKSDVLTNLLNLCLESNAQQVIIPLFDLLYLDDEARINVPSTLSAHNWSYRLKDYQAIAEIMEIFQVD